MGQPLAGLIISPPLRQAHQAGLDHYLATGEGPVLGQHLELTAVRADGSDLPVELSITKVALPGPPLFTACLRDLTGRKTSQSRTAGPGQAAAPIRAAAKPGQPAGGVAHDFNNLLGVTLYYAAFVVQRAARDPAASADAEQIWAAAEQGAVQPARARRAFRGADRRSAR
jgi:hypothetical protein